MRPIPLVDRVNLKPGQSATLEILVSDLYQLSENCIPEPHGSTLPYFRSTYLSPSNRHDRKWPWKKMLEQFMMEDNGFFRVEVSKGYARHKFDEGTHRVWFLYNEFLQISGLPDFKISTEVAMVHPKNFGRHSIHRAAGKPEALPFRFLTTLMQNFQYLLWEKGYTIFTGGNYEKAIPEVASYSFLQSMLITFRNIETRQQHQKLVDDNETRTPAWVRELPWKYQPEFDKATTQTVDIIFRKRSKYSDPKHLSDLIHIFPKQLQPIYLSAISSKLNLDSYEDLILDRETANVASLKQRMNMILQTAVYRELYLGILDEMSVYLHEVDRSLSIPTLIGYTDILMRLQQGVNSGVSFTELVNMLGGRSYGTAKESYGPVRDCYLEMPANMPEPSRTRIITNVLDQIYEENMPNKGRKRRELIRWIKHAWTTMPSKYQHDFSEYMATESLDNICAYLPLSPLLPLKEARQLMKKTLKLVDESEYDHDITDRHLLIYQSSESLAKKGKAIITVNSEEEFPDEREELQIDSADLAEALMEYVPDNLFDLSLGAEVGDDDTIGSSKKKWESISAASSAILPSWFTSADIKVIQRPVVEMISGKYFVIRPKYLFTNWNGYHNEVEASIKDIQGSAHSFHKNLLLRTAHSIIPDQVYAVLPEGGAQVGIAINNEKYLSILAAFSHPLLIHSNMFMPRLINPSNYPIELFWFVNLTEETRGEVSIFGANCYDPVLRDSFFSKYRLSSDRALTDFYERACNLPKAYCSA